MPPTAFQCWKGELFYSPTDIKKQGRQTAIAPQTKKKQLIIHSSWLSSCENSQSPHTHIRCATLPR